MVLSDRQRRLIAICGLHGGKGRGDGIYAQPSEGDR